MSIYTKDNIPQDEFNKIGDYTYGNISIERAYGGCKFEMGKFCSLGQGIRALYWGKHQYNDITTYPFNMLHAQGWPAVQCTEVKGEDIKIGNDVWLANNVTILQGANIGDGAVIGAFSVVAGIVEPYSITVGNPAKEVRKRFRPYHIELLLEMQWWNWGIEHIRKNLAIISSPAIEALYDIWEMQIR